MRALPSARPHVVTISRPSGETADIELIPIPVGYGAALEAVYPPPVEFVDGKATPSEALRKEYEELKGLVFIARSITGDYALTAVEPAPGAKRAAWDAYARAVREEFRVAGFTSGDILALMRGVQVANEGHGLGKASSSPTVG